MSSDVYWVQAPCQGVSNEKTRQAVLLLFLMLRSFWCMRNHKGGRKFKAEIEQFIFAHSPMKRTGLCAWMAHLGDRGLLLLSCPLNTMAEFLRPEFGMIRRITAQWLTSWLKQIAITTAQRSIANAPIQTAKANLTNTSPCWKKKKTN